jgi:hypothetical protein
MEPAFLKVKLFSSTPTALTEQIMKNVQHSFFSNSKQFILSCQTKLAMI